MLGEIIMEPCGEMIDISRPLIRLRLHGPRFTMQMVPGGARKDIHPGMRTSSTISLFSEQPELNQRPYSFVFSILAHGVAFGLIFLGIISAPKVKVQVAVQRYEVRHLDLHTLDAEMQRARIDFRNEIKAPRAPSK